MKEPNLQPEPQVIHKGDFLDPSEWADMLDSREANRMADEIAIRQAVEDGTFTEEEARALMEGSEEPTLEYLRSLSAQK